MKQHYFPLKFVKDVKPREREKKKQQMSFYSQDFILLKVLLRESEAARLRSRIQVTYRCVKVKLFSKRKHSIKDPYRIELEERGKKTKQNPNLLCPCPGG